MIQLGEVQERILDKIEREVRSVQSVSGSTQTEEVLLVEWADSLRSLRQFVTTQFDALRRDTAPVADKPVQREDDGTILFA